jgi:hypothetical protein
VAETGMITCQCGRQFRWKQELAGRKARCKCGQVLTVPATPEEAPVDDLYALADEDQPAAAAAMKPATKPAAASVAAPAASTVGGSGRKSPAKAPVVIAGAGGTGIAPAAVAPTAAASPARVLPYGGPLPRRFDKDEFKNQLGGEGWREMYLPAGLVLLGLGMQVFQNMYDGGSWRSFSAALPFVGVSMMFNLVLSFAGVLIVARLLEVSFGAPGPAVLKLAATCLLPPAIAASVGGAVGYDSFFVRTMTSALLLFPLAFLSFKLLFDLDFDEAVYGVVIIWLVNEWIVVLLVGVLLGGSGMFGGLGAEAEQSRDQWAAEQVRKRSAIEAQEWLNGNQMVFFGIRTGRETSEQVVKDLYEAGATRLTALTEAHQRECHALVVTLPRDAAARERIFKWYGNWIRSNPGMPDEDEGQKYLVIRFVSF